MAVPIKKQSNGFNIATGYSTGIGFLQASGLHRRSDLTGRRIDGREADWSPDATKRKSCGIKLIASNFVHQADKNR